MNKRKQIILNTIIREHIKTGNPVGSNVLVDKYKLDISPATVRSEMAVLEEEGYIAQPYTSAGRVPTEMAYKIFLDNLENSKLSKKESDSLEKVLRVNNEHSFKEAAKIIAQASGNTVFWAFHQHNLYYTGIANLFHQPEFREVDLIHNMSAVIDRFDEIIDDILSNIKIGTHVILGSNNPFGNFCGTILTKYKLDGHIGLVGILGPMRMDYEKNLALVNFINKIICNK